MILNTQILPELATVRRLIDYVLLNTCSVNSSGLYNGKAGMSLALFEAAKYLHDEKVEDEAFRLLQESLLTETNDYSFENGLSGIGYVLLYLIENGFLDADFNEIFNKQFERIIKSFADIENNPSRLLSSFNVIYFLVKVKNKNQNDLINKVIQKIFEGIELYLSLQFFDFTNLKYSNSKVLVLSIFDRYLKLVNFACYSNFSRVLLDLYAHLYRSNKIVSNYFTGYLLENNVKDYIEKYKDIIQDNKQYGALNLYNNSLLLHEQIDVFSYLQKDNLSRTNAIILEIIEQDWVHSQPENLWGKFNYRIPQHANILGYGFGLSRLLVFYINKKHLFV